MPEERPEPIGFERPIERSFQPGGSDAIDFGEPLENQTSPFGQRVNKSTAEGFGDPFARFRDTMRNIRQPLMREQQTRVRPEQQSPLVQDLRQRHAGLMRDRARIEEQFERRRGRGAPAEEELQGLIGQGSEATFSRILGGEPGRDENQRLVASYFQFQQTDVLATSLNRNQYADIKTQRFDLETTENNLDTRTKLLAPNEVAIEAGKGAIGGLTFPQASFHPKGSARRFERDGEERIMATVGTQNVTTGLRGQNVENVLVFQGRADDKQDPFVSVATEIERVVKGINNTVGRFMSRERDEGETAEQRQQQIRTEIGKVQGEDSTVVINDQFLQRMEKTLSELWQKRDEPGIKGTTVYLSFGEIKSLFKAESEQSPTIRSIKKHLSSLAEKGGPVNVKVLTRMGQFSSPDEGKDEFEKIKNDRLYQNLVNRESFVDVPAGFYHDKSFAVVKHNKTTEDQLLAFGTGSAQLTQTSLHENIELGVFFRGNQLIGQNETEQGADDVLSKLQSQSMVPPSERYQELATEGSSPQRFLVEGQPNVDSEGVEQLKQQLESLKSQYGAGKIEIERQYNPSVGDTDQQLRALNVKVKDSLGQESSSLRLTVKSDGGEQVVTVSDKDISLSGSVFVNRTSQELDLRRSDGSVETLSPEGAMRLNSMETATGLVGTLVRSLDYQSRFKAVDEVYSKLGEIERVEAAKSLLTRELQEVFTAEGDKANIGSLQEGLEKIQRDYRTREERHKLMTRLTSQLVSQGADFDIQQSQELELQGVVNILAGDYRETDRAATRMAFNLAMGVDNSYGQFSPLQPIKYRLVQESEVGRSAYRIANKDLTKQIEEQILAPFGVAGGSGMQGFARMPVFGAEEGELQDIEQSIGYGIGQAGPTQHALMSPLAVKHGDVISTSDSPTGGVFFRAISSVSYRKATSRQSLGGLREVETIDDDEVGAAPIYDMAYLTRGMDHLSVTTLGEFKETVGKLDSQFGLGLGRLQGLHGRFDRFNEEFEEGDEAQLFLMPFRKADQISQRIKNMIGTRPMKEVSQQTVTKVYSGQPISPFELNPETFNVGEITTALPQKQFEYFKRLLDEEGSYEAARDRLRREIGSDPNAFTKGFIDQSRPRLIGVVLGASSMSDFGYNNPAYEAEWSYTARKRIQFNATEVVDPNRTKTQILERLTPGTRIFGGKTALEAPETQFFNALRVEYNQFLREEGNSDRAIKRLRQRLDDDQFRSIGIQTGENNNLRFTLETGAYQFDQEGRPQRVAPMDDEGYLTVGYKSARSPMGPTTVPIKYKPTAYTNQYEQGVTVIAETSSGAQQDNNRFFIEVREEAIKRPGSGLRPGTPNIKGGMLYLEQEYFRSIAKTLNQRDESGRFLPDSVAGDQIQGQDIYGVYGPGSLKSFNFEGGAYMLGDPKVREQLRNLSGEEIAKGLGLLFLEDYEQGQPVAEALKSTVATGSPSEAFLDRQAKQMQKPGKLSVEGMSNMELSATGLLAFAESSTQETGSIFSTDFATEPTDMFISGQDIGKPAEPEERPLERVRSLVVKALRNEEGAKQELKQRMEGLISLLETDESYGKSVEGKLFLNQTSPVVRGASLATYLVTTGTEFLTPQFPTEGRAIYDAPDIRMTREDQYRDSVRQKEGRGALAEAIVNLERGYQQQGKEETDEGVPKLKMAEKASIEAFVEYASGEQIRNIVRRQSDTKAKEEIEQLLTAVHTQMQNPVMVKQLVRLNPSQSLVSTGMQDVGRLEYQYMQSFGKTLSREFLHKPSEQELDIRLAYAMLANIERGFQFPTTTDAYNLQSKLIAERTQETTAQVVDKISMSLPYLAQPDGENLAESVADRLTQAGPHFEDLLEGAKALKFAIRGFTEDRRDLTVEERIGQTEKALTDFNEKLASVGLEPVRISGLSSKSLSSSDQTELDYQWRQQRSSLQKEMEEAVQISETKQVLESLRSMWKAAEAQGDERLKQELNRTQELVIPQVTLQESQAIVASPGEKEPIRMLVPGLNILDNLNIEYPGFDDPLLQKVAEARRLNYQLREIDARLTTEPTQVTPEEGDLLKRRESLSQEIRAEISKLAATSLSEESAGDYARIPGTSFPAVRSFLVDYHETAFGERIDSVEGEYKTRDYRPYVAGLTGSHLQKRMRELDRDTATRTSYVSDDNEFDILLTELDSTQRETEYKRYREAKSNVEQLEYFSRKLYRENRVRLGSIDRQRRKQQALLNRLEYSLRKGLYTDVDESGRTLQSPDIGNTTKWKQAQFRLPAAGETSARDKATSVQTGETQARLPATGETQARLPAAGETYQPTSEAEKAYFRPAFDIRPKQIPGVPKGDVYKNIVELADQIQSGGSRRNLSRRKQERVDRFYSRGRVLSLPDQSASGAMFVTRKEQQTLDRQLIETYLGRQMKDLSERLSWEYFDRVVSQGKPERLPEYEQSRQAYEESAEKNLLRSSPDNLDVVEGMVERIYGKDSESLRQFQEQRRKFESTRQQFMEAGQDRLAKKAVETMRSVQQFERRKRIEAVRTYAPSMAILAQAEEQAGLVQRGYRGQEEPLTESLQALQTELSKRVSEEQYAFGRVQGQPVKAPEDNLFTPVPYRSYEPDKSGYLRGRRAQREVNLGFGYLQSLAQSVTETQETIRQSTDPAEQHLAIKSQQETAPKLERELGRIQDVLQRGRVEKTDSAISPWLSNLYQGYLQNDRNMTSGASPLSDFLMRGLQGDRDVAINSDMIPQALADEIRRVDSASSDLRKALASKIASVDVNDRRTFSEIDRKLLLNSDQAPETVERLQTLDRQFNRRLMRDVQRGMKQAPLSTDPVEQAKAMEDRRALEEQIRESYRKEIGVFRGQLARKLGVAPNRISIQTEPDQETVSALADRLQGQYRKAREAAEQQRAKVQQLQSEYEQVQASAARRREKVRQLELEQRREIERNRQAIEQTAGSVEEYERRIKEIHSGLRETRRRQKDRLLEDIRQSGGIDELRQTLDRISPELMDEDEKQELLAQAGKMEMLKDQAMVFRGGAPQGIHTMLKGENEGQLIGDIISIGEMNRRAPQDESLLRLAHDRAKTAMVMPGFGAYFGQQGDFDGDTYMALMSKSRRIQQDTQQLDAEVGAIRQKYNQAQQQLTELESQGADSREIESLRQKVYNLGSQLETLQKDKHEKDQEYQEILNAQQERSKNRYKNLERNIRRWQQGYTGLPGYLFQETDEAGNLQPARMGGSASQFQYNADEEVFTAQQLSTWMNSMRSVNEQLMAGQDGNRVVKRALEAFDAVGGDEKVRLNEIKAQLTHEDDEEVKEEINRLFSREGLGGESRAEQRNRLATEIAQSQNMNTAQEDFAKLIGNASGQAVTEAQQEAQQGVIGVSGGQILGEAYNAFVPMMHFASSQMTFQWSLGQKNLNISAVEEGKEEPILNRPKQEAETIRYWGNPYQDFKEKYKTKLSELQGGQATQSQVDKVLGNNRQDLMTELDEYYRSIFQIVSNVQVIVRDDALKPQGDSSNITETVQQGMDAGRIPVSPQSRGANITRMKELEKVALSELGNDLNLSANEQFRTSSIGVMRMAYWYTHSTADDIQREVESQLNNRSNEPKPYVMDAMQLFKQQKGRKPDTGDMKEVMGMMEDALVEFTARTQASFQAESNLELGEKELKTSIERMYAKSKSVLAEENRQGKKAQEARLLTQAVESHLGADPSRETFQNWLDKETSQTIMRDIIYNQLSKGPRRNIVAETYRQTAKLNQATQKLRRSSSPDQALGDQDTLISQLAIHATTQRGHLQDQEQHQKLSHTALKHLDAWAREVGDPAKMLGSDQQLNQEQHDMVAARANMIYGLVGGYGLQGETGDNVSDKEKIAFTQALFEGYDPTDPENDTSHFGRMMAISEGMERQVKHIEALAKIGRQIDETSDAKVEERLEKAYQQHLNELGPSISSRYAQETGSREKTAEEIGREKLSQIQKEKEEALNPLDPEAARRTQQYHQEQVARNRQIDRAQEAAGGSEMISGLMAPALLALMGSGVGDAMDERAAMFGYDVMQATAEMGDTTSRSTYALQTQRHLVGDKDMGAAAKAFRMQRARMAMENQDTLIEGALAATAQESAVKAFGRAVEGVSRKVGGGGQSGRALASLVGVATELMGDALMMAGGRMFSQSDGMPASPPGQMPNYLIEYLQKQTERIRKATRRALENAGDSDDVTTYVYNEQVDFIESAEPTLADKVEIGLRVVGESGESDVPVEEGDMTIEDGSTSEGEESTTTVGA